jgi:hypothetical protein
MGAGRGSKRAPDLKPTFPVPVNPKNPFLPAVDGLVTEDRLYEAIIFEVKLLPAITGVEAFQHPQYERAWKVLESVFDGEEPFYIFPSGRVLTPCADFNWTQIRKG